MSDETDSLDDQAADEEAGYFMKLASAERRARTVERMKEPKIGSKAWMRRRIAGIISDGTMHERLARLFVANDIGSLEATTYLKKCPDDVAVCTLKVLKDYETNGTFSAYLLR